MLLMPPLTPTTGRTAWLCAAFLMPVTLLPRPSDDGIDADIGHGIDSRFRECRESTGHVGIYAGPGMIRPRNEAELS